jgi:SAM-dependent methyltransferase
MSQTLEPTLASSPFDPTKAEAFTQKMLASLNAAALTLMTSIGHRTGLFDTLADLPAPVTPDQLADRAGLSPRYVREWLGAMTTSGVVTHDPAANTYALPPEHAACLTRAASPHNLATAMQWIAVLGDVEDAVVAAFTHGKGVPYSAYPRFHEVMAEESAQTVVAALFDHILSLVPNLTDRLTAGLDVLDVGCGAGRALITLAAAFPKSRFTGYDFSREAVAAARANAATRNLTNIYFEPRDAAQPFTANAFDLVTAFDAIHDQANPAAVLSNIRTTLRPGGLFLMQDILAHSHHHQNADHPAGTFIYTISCMHCMSVSLAHGGPGLGAAWGMEKALEMLTAAGFPETTVRTLPHDPMNFYYLAPVP